MLGLKFSKITFLLPLLLAPTLFGIHPAAAASGDSIFVVSYGQGVKKVSIPGGGTATTVGSAANNVAIWATSTHIYYGFNSIRRMNLDGTGATLLRSVTGSYNFVTDANYIYYGYELGRRIGRMNLDGTGANDSWIDYSSNSSAPFSSVLLIEGSNIYFGGGNNGGIGGYAGNIWKVPVTGGTPTSFASDTNTNAGIQDLVSDGSYIYWSNFQTGTLGRVRLDGTGNESNWVTGLSSPWGMDIVGTTVYFNHSGYIGKISTDGTGLNSQWNSNGFASQGLAVGGVPNTATVTMQLVSGASTLVFRQTTNALLRATVSAGGKVAFYQNGKIIPGCRFNVTTSGNVDCAWKPSIHGLATVYAVISSPTSAFPTARSSSISVGVAKRSNQR